jgi:ABC-type uncharacterized transport system substrate-binding protein
MFTSKITRAPSSRILIIFISGIMALALWSGPCFSHPHVFVGSELEIELGDKGVTGIWHHWTFDEYFSAWIVDEYDENKDGLFSREETEKLYEEAFKNLKEYGFWTRILIGDREIPVTGIERFSVELEDHQATYSFFIPLDISITSKTDMFIAVFDEDFYCQIFFPPNEVGFKGNLSQWKIDHTTMKMPDLTYYFGFITPIAVRLSITPS